MALYMFQTKMCLFCPYIYSCLLRASCRHVEQQVPNTLNGRSVLLVHHHLSHQHLPPYRWGEFKHEHKTGVLGLSELPLQRSVPTKLYTSFQSHQFHINFPTQCQVMNFILSHHCKSLYPSCSILKQTLESAQETNEFSNEMSLSLTKIVNRMKRNVQQITSPFSISTL